MHITGVYIYLVIQYECCRLWQHSGCKLCASVIQHEIGHSVGMRHTGYMNRAYSCGGTAVNEGASTVGAILIPGTPSGPDANSWMLACSNGGNRNFNANDVVAFNYLY